MGNPTSAGFLLRSASEDPRLLKALGWLAGVFAMVAVTIGGGIFSVPQRVALYLPSGVAILALWTAIGFVCLMGGLIWAEMGTRMPFSGGGYHYLVHAFGPALGFLQGWKALLLTGSQNRAALAIAAADYAGAFVPLSRDGHLIVALLALVLTGGVNYFGVHWASRFQSASAILKVLGLLALIVAGLLFAPTVGSPGAGIDAQESRVSAGTLPGVLLLIFFSYTGWARLGYLTGEMKDARRDLPRAIVVGMLSVLGIYALINWLCLRTVGIDGMRDSPTVVTDVARSFLGEAGSLFVAALIIVSITGSMSVSIMSHSRLFFSMAKDGMFFRFFDAVHPKFHTPHRAVVIHVSMAILALVLVRDFTALLTSAVFLNVIFYILKAQTLFRLRRDRVGEDRCYRVPLYPWLPLVFLVTLYGVLLSRLILDWHRAWIDATLLLIGLPAYALWRRLSQR